MQHLHIRRLAALALVVGAVATPSASARVPDTGPAAGAGTAAIERPRQDLRSPDARDAALGTSSLAGTASPRQDLRSPDAVDAAAGRGTFSAPDVIIVPAPKPAPQPVADGIDWADAGIGAGVLAGLVLMGLGSALLVVHRRQAQAA